MIGPVPPCSCIDPASWRGKFFFVRGVSLIDFARNKIKLEDSPPLVSLTRRGAISAVFTLTSTSGLDRLLAPRVLKGKGQARSIWLVVSIKNWHQGGISAVDSEIGSQQTTR